MKIQHLAVIFILIIVPISLVLSEYIHSHITTIENQTQYSTRLINATYDATKAFQLNTANNNYSTIGNSKIRDIEAAVNTFYNTLGTSMGSSGYNSEDLRLYVPAILTTLYDGYYIYTSYYDTELDTDGDGNSDGGYTYGLKPFITYSCRYIKGNNYDFVVNYTLDNTITVIGKVEGNYETKTGHLIDVNTNLTVNEEVLTENLIIIKDDGKYEVSDSNGNPKTSNYEYIVYNNNRYYFNKDYYIQNNKPNNKEKFFTYSAEYRKNYVSFSGEDPLGTDVWNYLNNQIKTTSDGPHLMSNSASKYYSDAITFSNWANDKLREISAEDAVDNSGTKITDFAVDTGNEKIFVTDNSNNPLQSGSTFNEHRQNVIRKTIETNLSTAIANYNYRSQIGSGFAMPKLGEMDWEKIENNVCFVSFLQGMPIGGKTFNKYCVVSNNTNQESIGNDSIYIITRDKNTIDSKLYYHKPGCKTLLNGLANGTLEIVAAYSSSDFERKSVSLTGADANAHTQLNGTTDGDNAFFYPQNNTACYDCIVTTSDSYSTDDIIAGKIVDSNITYDITQSDSNANAIRILRNEYLKALARCRYDLYTTNGYFGV